ncbi:MAG: M42 family peptidase, partial [Bacillota bacterium]|nr:M42 family peptidase [Bacillota bacterium]
MLLKELSEACGVSGQEGPVRDLVRRHLEGQVEEMRTDALGNLLVRARAAGRRRAGGPVVMVAAHLDEVGLMVTGIESHGLLRFRTVGHIDPRVLVSQVVSIGPEGIRGVVGCKPIHLQERGEEKKPFPLRDLVIDIGASSREEAERSVRLGQVAAFTTRCEELGGGVLKGKAFDD